MYILRVETPTYTYANQPSSYFFSSSSPLMQLAAETLVDYYEYTDLAEAEKAGEELLRKDRERMVLIYKERYDLQLEDVPAQTRLTVGIL